MKRFIVVFLALILTTSCCLTGCSKPTEITEKDISGKTYVYEKDGFGGNFTVTLNEDGTFSYYEGMLSSYIGYGNWTLEKNRLHLKDTGTGKIRNHYFEVQGSDLIFLYEDSDNFMYLKLADGERFFHAKDTEGLIIPKITDTNIAN